jgi:hypothetical protein
MSPKIDQTKPSKANRQLKRIYITAFLLLIVGAALISSLPIAETDIFWHLASGRFILDQGRLPNPDPFTYTARYWQDVDHEWLSQIILAVIDNVTGLRGLRIARALLVAVTLVLGFISFYRISKRYDLALIAAAFWWVLMQPNVSIRPHLFGWVFSVLILGLLLPRSQSWKLKHYIILFVLSVIWINLHPSVMIIPVFCMLYAVSAIIGIIINRKKEFQTLAEDMDSHKPFIIASIVSIIACFVQPAGIRLFPFVMTPGMSIGINNEWLPFLASDVWKYRPFLLIVYFVIAAWTIVAIFLTRKHGLMKYHGPIIAIFTLLMAAEIRRMTFFIFMALLFTVYATAQWLEKSLRKQIKPSLAVIFSLVLVFGSLWITKRPGVPFFMEKDILPGQFPEKASESLERVQLQGNMFNPATWGGYLSYRLYPSYKTMCDGQWILVGRDFILDNSRILNRQGNVEEIIERYNIDYFIEPFGSYIERLPLDPDKWILAYNDKTSVILLRRTSKLQENLARVCDFYKRNSDFLRYSQWQVRYRETPGQATPTSIPSAINFCIGFKK